MAIEYLYDAIRATAGSDICICAEAFDEEGERITDNCTLVLNDGVSELARAEGVYEDEAWKFHIPAAATKGLNGRYWYCIRHNNNRLCFNQPIYFR